VLLVEGCTNQQENRMNANTLARLTPFSRALLVERIVVEHWSVAEAAEAAGVSSRTAYKWLSRAERNDFSDRSSRPQRMPLKTPWGWERLVIELRRRCRMTAPAIARILGLPRSTVSRVLARNGLGKLKALEPKIEFKRYEHERPGDLLHLDTKKLGKIGRVGHRIHGDRTTRVRGIGWEFVHVCIDDHSRLAYVEVLADEKGATTAAFLKRAVAWFREQDVTVRRVLTDNGSGYLSQAFGNACVQLKLRHSRTRPYTPRTNGKAERFIQTLLREWAYQRPYSSSARRTAAMTPWLKYYNQRRPHGSLGTTPIARLRRVA
jgi:transposase InsO family protein